MARHSLIRRDRNNDGATEAEPTTTRDRTVDDRGYDRGYDRDGDGRDDGIVDRTRDRDRDYDYDRDRDRREHHVVTPSAHDRFGGTNWGACFFGWLVAVGVTVLLAAITSAVATAVGTNLNWSLSDAENNAASVGLAAAIAIAVIMFIGYYAGGYVAGRMSRFDGPRQGVGVWLIGILAVAIAAAVTAIFGSRYDVLQQMDLPSLNLTNDQLSAGAIVTAVVLLVVMLVGAIVGASVGRRYHRKVDAVIVEH